jgi:TrmH family RNA methyltransferase
VKEVSSRSNPRFKLWLSLTEAKGLRQNHLCLVSGKKLIDEVLREAPESLEDFLLPPGSMPPPQLPIPATRLTAPLFKEVDVIGTKAPIAVVRTTPIEPWKFHAPRGLELVLALSDPANLGGVLRSAAAFGVKRVILTEECASPFLPKALRASAGTALKISFSRIGSLKTSQFDSEVFGLDMTGENLSGFKWPQNGLLVLGEEGQGLPSTLAIKRLMIPMAPGVESLNAMVAASLALYSYALQHPVGLEQRGT